MNKDIMKVAAACSRITELIAICQENVSLHNDLIAKNEALTAKRENEIASSWSDRNELFTKLLPTLSINEDDLRVRQDCFENQMRHKTQETNDLLTVHQHNVAKFIAHASKVMGVSVIDHARSVTAQINKKRLREEEEKASANVKLPSLWR